MATLLCPVRGCRLALVQDRAWWVCARGHSFDVARSGYVNLLQPQDRRSRQPGDTGAAMEARRRLHESGVTAPLLRGIGELLDAGREDEVLDAGCGDGFFLGSLARESGCAGHGVDISIRAVDAAARRYPECAWVVANADRFVPYQDGSFSAVLSIAGRMNAVEFRRVLDQRGRLLVAVPAPDDLIELRGSGRDRIARTVETFADGFVLRERRRVTTTAELERAQVEDALHSIYRPKARGEVKATRVTFSFDVLLFGARDSRS